MLIIHFQVKTILSISNKFILVFLNYPKIKGQDNARILHLL